jgi:hypothetical protein
MFKDRNMVAITNLKCQTPNIRSNSSFLRSPNANLFVNHTNRTNRHRMRIPSHHLLRAVRPTLILLQGKLVPLACIVLGRRMENEGTIKCLIFLGWTLAHIWALSKWSDWKGCQASCWFNWLLLNFNCLGKL